MTKKPLVIFSGLIVALILFGTASAQTTLDELTEKLNAISTEGKAPLEVLQEITQEGELDATIPKTTITKDGRTETIFAFEFVENPQGAFQDLQNYFTKQENFQALNYKEEGSIKAIELNKGTTIILLAQTGSIVVESRQEDAAVFPEAPPVAAGGEEGAAGPEAGAIPSWVWIVIAVVVVLVIVVVAVKKATERKKK